MNFCRLAKDYLRELHGALSTAVTSGEATPELSFRHTLNTFFGRATQAISKEIKIVHEPRSQGKAGRPDWRFHNASNLGVYGYCEAKPPDILHKLNLRSHAEQFSKYATLKQRLIVTDGIEFHFFDPVTRQVTECSLLTKPLHLRSLLSAEPDPRMENALRTFFKDTGLRECTEDQLIEECALRATQLARAVTELAGAPVGSGLTASENRTINALRRLKQLLATHQDANLKTPEAFADFVAQVLIFGLVYAHRIVLQPADASITRYNKMHAFWAHVVYKQQSAHLRPFRALVQTLGRELGGTSLGAVGTWYNDCRMMLAHVHLTTKQRTAPDYHTLFERFLTAYDPSTRFNYGAFYTPRPVAAFATGIAAALASVRLAPTTLFDRGNRIVDPCCGTGSFIEALLATTRPRGFKASLTGLEILPGPYALAHYRLNMLSHRAYPHAVKVLLTDTLADALQNAAHTTRPTNPFAQEQQDAKRLSTPPLTLIIGNPPSIDPQHQKERQVPNQTAILQLLEDWRPPEGSRSARQNTQKQLRNEFVKFLRWGCARLDLHAPGMVSLVLPSSFADKPTYQFAREWLLRFFDEIWVLGIDSDSRRGLQTESLFSTLQGRLLFLGYRSGHKQTARKAVRYATIAAMPQEAKIRFLEKRRQFEDYARLFESVKPQAPLWSFAPSRNFDKALYNRFWPLGDHSTEAQGSTTAIVQRHCSAVKLAPTALLTHATRELLHRKLLFASHPSRTYAEIRDTWFSGQQKVPKSEKLSEPVRAAIRRSLNNTRAFTGTRWCSWRRTRRGCRMWTKRCGGARHGVPSCVKAWPQVDRNMHIFPDRPA